ncbi:glutathione S-transferase family protein [Parahaliea mediterranea]|uniref:Glutathione S-transferase n=1 Tax=Parahaliea mediterranea TaxID=651086 RepID=A0A939DGX5_9GAMM|nr:glutathione S-transferase [Parahaliea mediterranea]MBN7797976.1 glutathione S-transferase [Parahaliea mediterranea]
MSAQYTLYGGELSLYTGKARAYLRYKGLDFQELPATREVYKTIIVPRVGAPIVPVLVTDDDQLVQDTTEIIDFLEARHPACPVYPQGGLQRLVALMLEFYGDEWLVIPAMHYRWSVLDEQYDFIMREFGAMNAPGASEEEQIRIGEKISAPFRGSIAHLGITKGTIDGIERAYAELLEQLDGHFAQYDYLLGSRPSIGDFGLIGPLYAHLGRDPVPRALMERTAPHVYRWVQRMNRPVPRGGEFLADDRVPDSLLPVLATMCRDHLPDALDVVARNAQWLRDNPGGKLPRVLGMHPFTTGGASGERYVHSYAQWLFQRCLDQYQSLRDEERQRADILLATVGGLEAMQTRITHRVARVPGQLELVEA